MWHFQNRCVKSSFSSRPAAKSTFSVLSNSYFCRWLLVGKRLCKNLKLKINCVFRSLYKCLLLEKRFSSEHFYRLKSRCLYAICCLKTILDDFWFLKNVLKELSCCWCSRAGFIVAKISRLRLFRKTLRVLLEYHIYSENGRRKGSRENYHLLDV